MIGKTGFIRITYRGWWQLPAPWKWQSMLNIILASVSSSPMIFCKHVDLHEVEHYWSSGGERLTRLKKTTLKYRLPSSMEVGLSLVRKNVKAVTMPICNRLRAQLCEDSRTPSVLKSRRIETSWAFQRGKWILTSIVLKNLHHSNLDSISQQVLWRNGQWWLKTDMQIGDWILADTAIESILHAPRRPEPGQ